MQLLRCKAHLRFVSWPCIATRAHPKAWDEIVDLEVGPHPDLSPNQRRVIELDYGMQDGCVKIPVRRALLYYSLKRLGLDTDPAARPPQDQQIVLLNREAIHADH